MTSRDSRLVIARYRGSYHSPMAGTWMPSEGAPYFSCPGCGRLTQMSNHTIDASGTVEASVGCEACDFHEFVTLGGFWLTES